MSVRKCAVCDETFPELFSGYQKLTCSPRCKDTKKQRARAKRRLGNCEICGGEAWQNKAHYGPRCKDCFSLAACAGCGILAPGLYGARKCEFCRLSQCQQCGEITDRLTICVDCLEPESLPRGCPHCGGPFAGRRSKVYCTQFCRDATSVAKNKLMNGGKRSPQKRTERVIAAEQARDAKTRGSLTVYMVHRMRLFERDRWTCQICKSPVNKSLVFPDSGSPSLDHIIPVSKGGSHTEYNLQLTHLSCNLKKSATMPDLLQLPIF